MFTLPPDVMRSFSPVPCHKTKLSDLTKKSLLAVLAELRLSTAIPFKEPSKSPASLILRYSSPLLGFTFNNPCPELGSVPTDTCPLELMRTL